MIQEINENNNTNINVKEITTTTQATTDTDTNLNEEDLFYDFIETELVPKYGLPELQLEQIDYVSQTHPNYTLMHEVNILVGGESYLTFRSFSSMPIKIKDDRNEIGALMVNANYSRHIKN